MNFPERSRKLSPPNERWKPPNSVAFHIVSYRAENRALTFSYSLRKEVESEQ